MNKLPGTLPRTNLEARRFDFFFDRLESCLRKGRGFSLFRADDASVTEFSEGCKRRGLAPFTIRLSTYLNELADLPAAPGFVILIQDLSYADFLDQVSLIADKVVFPLWFRRIPICFFSTLDRAEYENQPIRADDLHRDFSGVVRALLAEQALTLLDRSNYQFASPDSLELAPRG